MEYFDIELIYQHLKDNYPNIDPLMMLISKEWLNVTTNILPCDAVYFPKFCHFDMDTIIIFSNRNNWEELWPEDFNNHEEVFQKIYELAVTRPTIYRDYLLAKQRDKRIDDILLD
jgi:hypothetical protein